MKLKGIELKGTYKVRYYDTGFVIYDEKGNTFYREDGNAHWFRRKYEIYYENNKGYWVKREYNEKGDAIYLENSDGRIIDKRVKELTIEEIEKLLGYKIKIKGERK